MEVRDLEEMYADIYYYYYKIIYDKCSGWPMKLNLEQYPDCVGVELRDKTIMIQMDRE